jgi:hypothetical protein
LGWARITHPFHPFRNQQFLILKIRRVSGLDTLILRDTTTGTFAVPAAWTDRAPPPHEGWSKAACLVDGQALLQLAKLIDASNGDADQGLDP